MKAENLIRDLQSRGVQLSVENGALILNGPETALNDETIEMLRPHKPALLRLLSNGPSRQSDACLSCGSASDSPTGRELMPEVLERPECPECHAPLDLQDRARDTWWCIGCQIFFVAGVVQ